MSESLWYVNESRGIKRVHTESCRFAKDPYRYADGMTAPELVDALAGSGAIEWHDACHICAPNLSAAIARRRWDMSPERGL